MIHCCGVFAYRKYEHLPNSVRVYADFECLLDEKVLAATATATAVDLAVVIPKRKTRMNNWIWCKNFYTYTQETEYEF